MTPLSTPLPILRVDDKLVIPPHSPLNPRPNSSSTSPTYLHFRGYIDGTQMVFREFVKWAGYKRRGGGRYIYRIHGQQWWSAHCKDLTLVTNDSDNKAQVTTGLAYGSTRPSSGKIASDDLLADIRRLIGNLEEMPKSTLDEAYELSVNLRRWLRSHLGLQSNHITKRTFKFKYVDRPETTIHTLESLYEGTIDGIEVPLSGRDVYDIVRLDVGDTAEMGVQVEYKRAGPVVTRLT